MAKNNLCCRIFPIIAVLISALIGGVIWYFDEGIHELRFLNDRGEFFNYLGTVLFIALIPIGLFYWLNDKEKYQSRARPLAMLGFLPALAYLVFIFI